jgi:hypothetical protein
MFSILILNFVSDEKLSISNKCSLIEYILNHGHIFFRQLNAKFLTRLKRKSCSCA